jgi:LPXTG-motif cell wall-anchored protein
MISANVYYYLKQRTIALLTLTFAFILSPVFCFAQTDPDNPCDGSDPFADCPLDTWVIVLAGIALLATTLYLHRKRKTIIQNA